MSSTSQQTPQPFLWSQRCQNLPRFKIYRSGNCVCFSDAPPATLVLIVFEDENPGGYVIPVLYDRTSGCFCPTVDMAQFVQRGKWIYFIATELTDVNTIYACTDYIDNFYTSVDFSIKTNIRFEIITQLAPKNVYAVLEIQLDSSMPFPNLPFLTLRDMCWADTPWGRLPYVCRLGYTFTVYMSISRYCENNNLNPPDWVTQFDTWYTFLDAEFEYQPNRIVIRKVFDETALFNPINTGYYCTDDAGRQIPIKATWLDIDSFTVESYNEIIVYEIDSNANVICEWQVGVICIPAPTGISVNIGNPFKVAEDEYIKARQLIGLQLNMVGLLSNVQDALGKVASAVSTTILNALNIFPFYIPPTPTEGLKPVYEPFISFLAQVIVSSIEGAVSRAVRIVIKNIARTYMALKTYFELGLSTPTSAVILFLNHFIKLIADIACRIASKCIGFVSIVLTIPYAVKRLREVAEQEYDIKKPLTSIRNMLIGFGEAVRDIFTTWLASIFAGAVLCPFAKCPKLESIPPPFIHLPDWYVFEDFCADLCRVPLIEGRIRDYMTCVSKCIAMFAPRIPAKELVVVERDRATVYINESLSPADVQAGPPPPKNVPISWESMSLGDTASITKRDRIVLSEVESIGLSDAYSYITAISITSGGTQGIRESMGFFDTASCSIAFETLTKFSESIGSMDSLSISTAFAVSRTVEESIGSTDKIPEWIPLPYIKPYARWVEAVSEYIEMPYGLSVVITNILTGETTKVNVASRAFHSVNVVSDSVSIEAMPAVFILPSDSTQDLVTDTMQIVTKPPIYMLLSDSTENMLTDLLSVGLVRLVKLSTPVALLAQIKMPGVPPYMKMLITYSAKGTLLYVLVPHTVRSKTAVKLTSPSRLTTYTLIPQVTRQKTGMQLASPAGLSTYILVPYAVRTKTGIQLTSPARTCTQITITV